jgi:hypothetical protein
MNQPALNKCPRCGLPTDSPDCFVDDCVCPPLPARPSSVDLPLHALVNAARIFRLWPSINCVARMSGSRSYVIAEHWQAPAELKCHVCKQPCVI